MLAGVALLAGSVRAQQAGPETEPSARRQTVGVTVFTNISRAEADQWISDGITETLAADLRATTGIEVVDCGPVSRATRGRTSLGVGVLEEVAALRRCRERGATWLIVGGYQRVGARLWITARLLDVATGGVQHTVRADGSVDELFVLQDQVVEAMGAELGSPRREPVTATVRRTPAPLDPSDRPSSPAPPVPAVSSPGPSAAPVATPVDGGVEASVVIDGPPAPPLPETIARDAAGRVMVRAVRLTEPLAIDGVLDEPVYRDVRPASGFIQVEPLLGEPATEQTNVWVFFDDDQIYVSARCWDSAPESEWVVNEMRRDHFNIGNGEVLNFLLDTFYDRRNGYLFNVNPIGGRFDGQLTNELFFNGDWNPIWEVRAGRFAQGWTMEAAIPFKSLRYRPGRSQVWGFNVQRNVRWKNEGSTLTPPAARGIQAMMQVSLAATLVGLEVPSGSRNLEIKPYAIGDLATDRTVSPPVANDVGGDAGLDVKYGITQNLVADLTVNTDFAQVEADEQQVNLTRFSLFFPEKREFFLESSGNFDFSGGNNILFFSRRIGLQGGRQVPIDVGGRLTGRVGPFSLGALNVQTDDEPVSGARATSFSVVRVKRDILRRSSIGALVTHRSVSTVSTGSNDAFGVDGTFAFFDHLRIETYLARTRTSGLSGDDASYRARLNYNGDRYGIIVDRHVVGDNFNPEVGFLPRDDFRANFALLRFSPRPQAIAAVRQLTFQASYNYLTDGTGRLETEVAQGFFGTGFENGDFFGVSAIREYEFLERPFPIAPGVTIPIGGYRFQSATVSYTLGTQRRLSGFVFVQHGGFFSGDRTNVGYNGRIEVTPQVSVEPGLSFNRVALPEGRFTTQLATTRAIYTVTPLMFVSALLQYNSSNDSFSTNVRLRWEYTPGSELFVVYNEERDTDPLVPDRFSELRNRAVIIKVNRLFRF